MALAHRGGNVAAYIKKREEESQLIIGFIEGSLTSVLQVCDLCANKEFKYFIKKLYMRWKAEFLKAEISKIPNNPNMHINIKIQVNDMTEIVAETPNLFNTVQHTSRYIKKIFCHGGQDLCKEYQVEFKAHLDVLYEISLYSNKIKCSTTGRLPADDQIAF